MKGWNIVAEYGVIGYINKVPDSQVAPAISTEYLSLPSSLLDQVMALHRLDAKTLGFFPAGAFDEHARERRIIVALDGQMLLGYLLFRLARGRAIIVHLCVSKLARGRGVARILSDRLKHDTRSLEGIGLYCRRDYDTHHLWAKLGFEAVNRKAGRGRDGAELTYWWFSHGHKDLFSTGSEPDADRQIVVIDANVFYDLHQRDTRDAEDSKALLADWVQSSIELVITKELRNEIAKAPDKSQRDSSLAEATRYKTLPANDQLFQKLCNELRPRFPESTTLRDDADLRQLAYAISGEASFFVTRDETLIERAEPLYSTHGLRVLHPAELINHLDAIERESEYKPARIHGSRFRDELLRGDLVDVVVEAFKLPNERTSEFHKLLMSCLSKSKSLETRVVSDAAGKMVLLGIIDRQAPGTLQIRCLRRSQHPLAPTMLRNHLRTFVDTAVSENRFVISAELESLKEGDLQALREFGFVECGSVGIKFTFRHIADLGGLIERLQRIELLNEFNETLLALIERIRNAPIDAGLSIALDAERQFWPAKVVGTDIPTFIVAIRPEWAQHFFDDHLGSQLLLGLRDELHLGVEGMYYRSAENNNLTVPGRILWYVSKGSGDGSMSIKACSQLEEVVVGKPKDLFRRFQRLGVYEWKDVYAAANQDLGAEISAFRFRMTERFEVPVESNVLDDMGIRGPFMSPRKVSDAQFEAIYKKGFRL